MDDDVWLTLQLTDTECDFLLRLRSALNDKARDAGI